MKTRRPWKSCALVLAILACPQLSAEPWQDPGVKLSPPVLAGSQVTFTLNCESSVQYIIESSVDLKSWTPVLTNGSPEINRTLSLDAPGQATFYRARRPSLPLFTAAIATSGDIDLNGKNLTSDSFDSADPNYSNNGLYPAGMLEKTKANGDLVTNSSLTNALSVGNLQAKGTIRTGPTGTVKIGPSGSVGDRAWVESGNPGIQPGHVSNSMNTYFPPLPPPIGSWFTPTKGTNVIEGVTYDYVLSSGSYRMNTIGTGNFKIYISGDVGLRVTNDIYMAGQDVIRIAPGGRLSLFMSGASARFGGNGVMNQSSNALDFRYFGLAGNTNVNFSGNSSITGVVWAPDATCQIGGGGSSAYDFVGAIITKSLRMNGHYKFHFDENLTRWPAVR